MDPLHHEFGWSHATVGLAMSVNMTLFGVTAPFAAALMDRFGVRPVLSVALSEFEALMLPVLLPSLVALSVALALPVGSVALLEALMLPSVGVVVGVLMGAVLVDTIDNSLTRWELVSEFWRDALLGMLIMVAVTLDTLASRSLARLRGTSGGPQ